VNLAWNPGLGHTYDLVVVASEMVEQKDEQLMSQARSVYDSAQLDEGIPGAALLAA